MSKAEAIFEEMASVVGQMGGELKSKFTGIVKFDITKVGNWVLDLKSEGNPTVTKDEGGKGKKPDLVIKVNDDDFALLYEGKLNAQQAFMKGKLKVKGNMGLAMKFEKVLNATRKTIEKSKKAKL